MKIGIVTYIIGVIIGFIFTFTIYYKEEQEEAKRTGDKIPLDYLLHMILLCICTSIISWVWVLIDIWYLICKFLKKKRK